MAGTQPLSPRELEVLKLLASGLTLAAIAAELGVHRGTVATHSSRAYRKLGVGAAHQAIVEAHRLGLIEL